MHARIGRWSGSKEELERWAERSRSEVVPQVLATAGSRGVLLLLGRERSEALTITLWETEQALAESESRRASIQHGTAKTSGAKVETERYEVVEAALR